MIKKIGLESRIDIAKIAGCPVHLFLFVKVQENWMNNPENFQDFNLKKIPKEKK
jgi:GTP-binding protein Era